MTSIAPKGRDAIGLNQCLNGQIDAVVEPDLGLADAVEFGNEGIS